MIYGILAATSFAAGMLQTMTGFGAGILLILVLSNFFSMVLAPALNTSICLGITLLLALRYRRGIRLKTVLLPCICFVGVSAAIISVVEYINLDALGICFGGFLIALSAFFLFFSSRIQLKAHWITAAVCGALSGVFSGLFGVGGPIMGLYLVTVSDDHEEYLGNLEFIFTAANVGNMITRIARGIYTWDMVPLTVLGLVFIGLGSVVGGRICGRINVNLLRRIVYIFVGVSGVITLIQHIL